MSYCSYCENLPEDNIHKIYHDNQYGFDIECDNELFGRLILEINQAGLSWNTILNKQENFRKAFDNFNISIISNYDTQKINELLNNPGIIRNRLKINAVIYNANQIIEIQKEFGTFKKWILLNNNNSLPEWVKLFKKNFKFVGGEIVNEFLMSIGQLPGAHIDSCKIYKTLQAN
ncbi:MAG: DNA-3-methyladenine glycosylase I [Flavobacteriia bacterium]|nr:DNA-3-methyladenine glycosylase I [Flavobacteriia bacterium]